MTTVYRHFDENHTLLYVGRSVNPLRRLEQHRYQSEWSGKIASITIERFDSFEQAKKAEALAILNEQPVYNVQHKESIDLDRKKARMYGPKLLKGQALRDWEWVKKTKAAWAADDAAKTKTLAAFAPKDKAIGG